MKLGFVSAILSDLGLDEVFRFAAESGYSSVEVMCWPPGKADSPVCWGHAPGRDDPEPRRGPPPPELRWMPTAWRSRAWGIIPTRSRPTPPSRTSPTSHLKRLIDAASDLGIGVVNSFVGTRSRALGRGQLAEVPPGLAADHRAGRGAQGPGWHRELPDAVHRRRVARRQEPGHHPERLA